MVGRSQLAGEKREGSLNEADELVNGFKSEKSQRL